MWMFKNLHTAIFWNNGTNLKGLKFQKLFAMFIIPVTRFSFYFNIKKGLKKSYTKRWLWNFNTYSDIHYMNTVYTGTCTLCT